MTERCPVCGAETHGTSYCTSCGARLAPSTPSPAPAPVPGTATGAAAAPAYASFGQRLIAFFLDALVIGFTALLLALAATAAYGAGAGRLPELWWSEGFFGLSAFLFGALGVAYHAVFTGESGQTPGKGAVGIAVADAGRRRLGHGRSLIRAFAYGLSWAPFWLGFLWALWDPRRQAWHDKIADTVVVRKE